MCLSDHSEVISVLTELYALLDTLAALPTGSLWLPASDSQNTSSYAYKSDAGEERFFKADAARAVGFSPIAVDFSASIPYSEHLTYIQPSTRVKCYLGQGEIGLGPERELFMGAAELLPPEAVRLTESSSICGTEFIYDVLTKRMHRWPDDNNGQYLNANEEARARNPDYFYNLPYSSPREALQPVIDKFRGLRYILEPVRDGGSWEHELLMLEDEDDEFKTSECAEDGWREEMYRRLRELYLECGWDVGAVEQRGFRRGEFLEKRRRGFMERKEI